MKLSSFLPSILYGKNPQNSTISRSWLTPSRGTVKVNFDAAHLPTTIGVIIQDSTHIFLIHLLPKFPAMMILNLAILVV